MSSLPLSPGPYLMLASCVYCLRAMLHALLVFIAQCSLPLHRSADRGRYALNMVNRRLGLRVDLIGQCFVFATALITVFAKGRADPALLALCLTYSLSITFLLNWTVHSPLPTTTQQRSPFS